MTARGTIVALARHAIAAIGLSAAMASAAPANDLTPVVLVPGALGTRLVDARSGREAWPGNLLVLPLRDFSGLALPLDGESRRRELVAGELLERIGPADYYAGLLRTLARAGYVRAAAGSAVPPGERRLYVFAYDWRRDNTAHAAALLAFIARIRAGHRDPALRVDLLAHSNGGLIAAWFLRYGARAADPAPRPWGDASGQVRRVITYGTPFEGTVTALESLVRGHPLAVQRLPPEAAATFPGVFELLPHGDSAPVIAPDGRPVSADLFDVATWRRRGWALWDPAVRTRLARRHRAGEPTIGERERAFERNLAQGRAFVEAIGRSPVPAGIEEVRLGAACHPTLARAVLASGPARGDRLLFSAAELRARALPPALTLAPGDGLVAAHSASGGHTDAPRFQQCADHAGLPSATPFTRLTLQILEGADS